jgi:hypothetical protein
MSKNFFLGEQVAFLNQKGGGVITKITKDQIWVCDETGFEIPFPPNELIKIKQPNGVFMESQHTDSDTYKHYSTHREVWIIWEPHNAENSSRGILRVGNASPFDLTVVLQGKYKGKHKRFWSGYIPLGQVSEPVTWREDDVEWLRQFLVICIPSLLVPHSFPEVLSMNLTTPKTFASNSKEELFLHPFSSNPAWVLNFNIAKEEIPVPHVTLTAIGLSAPKSVQKVGPPVTHKRVLDLHAAVLWKVPPPAKEVLAGQIEALHREITYCMKQGVERLTVIHGVGEGKLKEAVRKELSPYQNLKIEEANSADYGYGALTIWFEV